MRLHLCLPFLGLLLAPSLPQDADRSADSAPSDPLASIVERIEASPSVHEQVALARFGRRRDRGGSVWWYEVEARARLDAGEPAATVRLCDAALAALAGTPHGEDLAVVTRLRASAFRALGDRERELGDLLRLVSAGLASPELERRTHGLLGERTRVRQQLRARREAEGLVERYPEDVAARRSLAEVHGAQGRPAHAIESYRSAVEINADDLGIADWVRFGNLALGQLDGDTAFEAFDRAAHLDPDRDFGEELEQALLIQESMLGGGAWEDEAYGSYSEYSEYSEYEDSDAEIEEADPAPPTEVSDAQRQRELEAWGPILDAWESELEPHVSELYRLERCISELENELGLVNDVDELESFEPRVGDLEVELTAWVHQHRRRVDGAEALLATLSDRRRGLEASLDSDSGENSRRPWLETLGDLESRLVDHIDGLDVGTGEWPLELLGEAIELRRFVILEEQEAERLRREQEEAARLAAEERDRAVLELIENRSRLGAGELVLRSGELMARGSLDPNLLAIHGLGQAAEGNVPGAMVPLHLAAAGALRTDLEEEVRAVLASWVPRARGLAEAARSLRELGELRGAHGLAEQASDLGPGLAEAHAEEARALHALGEGAAALHAMRIATALDPGDGEALREHALMALDRREVSEARQLADQLVALDPRDSRALRFRAPILTLCREPDLAQADRAFASKVDSVAGWSFGEGWERDDHGNSAFLPARSWDGRPWSERSPAHLRQLLLWTPLGDGRDSVTDELVDRILGALVGSSEVEAIAEPIEGMASADVEVWDAVARFYIAEVYSARGDAERAARWYESARLESTLPLGLAHVISFRERTLLRTRAFSSHLPIRVPQDTKDLEGALRLAKPGQSIALGEGYHTLYEMPRKSVRVVGAGSDSTHVTLTSGICNVGHPDTDSAPWIEFQGLRLSQSESYALEEGEEPGRARIRVHRGTLRLTDVRMVSHTAIESSGEGQVVIEDCDLALGRWGPGKAIPVQIRGGRALLDRVVTDRPVHVEGGGQLLADALHLRRGAGVHLRDEQTQGWIGGLTLDGGVEPMLSCGGGAHLGVERAVARVDASIGWTHTDADSTLELTEVRLLGSTEVAMPSAEDGPVTVGGVVGSAFRNEAKSDPPRRVASGVALEAALSEGARHLVLAPGLYVLAGRPIDGELYMRAEGEGVQLQVRVDRDSHALSIQKDACVELEGIEFDVKTWRTPPADDPIGKHGGVHMLDKHHSRYGVLRVRGQLLLRDCTQGRNGGEDSVAQRVDLAWVEGGTWISVGLAGGRSAWIQDGAEAYFLDGGVEVLEIETGGRAHLAGLGGLRRLTVEGRKSQVVLEDLGTERLDYVAFRGGAFDPRCDLRRRSDGYDPEVLQRNALERALRKQEGRRSKADSPEGVGRTLAEYAADYERALGFTIPNRDERARRAVAEVIPEVDGRMGRVRGLLEGARGNYTLWSAVLSGLGTEDRRRVAAEAEAEWELGAEANAEALDAFADWSEAVRAGAVTRDEMGAGRRRGLTLREYRIEQAIRAREAAEREQEATAALSSGDRSRIRNALLAIGKERYVSWVRRQSDLSLEELRDAEVLAVGTQHEYWVYNQRRNLENALAAQQAQTYPNSSYGSFTRGSTYTAPDNSFNQWVQESKTWNRAMDNWMSDFKSRPYREYRNRYDY